MGQTVDIDKLFRQSMHIVNTIHRSKRLKITVGPENNEY